MVKPSDEAEFIYTNTLPFKKLDELGEQELWDEVAKAAERYRISLVQFWSTATPHRRREAERNRTQVGPSQ